jgi:hypothetical protein
MTLISVDLQEVRISLSPVEFELLRGYVEHAAEKDHDTVFNHPQLLAGFRSAKEQIEFAHEEGLLYE